MNREPLTKPEPAQMAGGPAAAREGVAVCVYVDTHVHLYPRYDTARFFDWAEQNFDRADAKAKWEGPYVGCLMLTETACDDAFGMLLERTAADDRDWSFTPCKDAASLWATRGDYRILVVAGCQVITCERLEVLVLGTRSRVADGLDINTTIRAALDTGGQVVLPYGLGKWTGKRAEIATKAFYKWHKHGLRLGDNAGRPRGLPDNGLFHCARKAHMPIFPGSDPLNIPSGERRAGCYGVVIETKLSEDFPAKDILRGLVDLPAAPTTFGKRVGMPGCCLQQFALRWHKRKSKRQ